MPQSSFAPFATQRNAEATQFDTSSCPSQFLLVLFDVDLLPRLDERQQFAAQFILGRIAAYDLPLKVLFPVKSQGSCKSRARL
jgi:hypothetical protein